MNQSKILSVGRVNDITDLICLCSCAPELICDNEAGGGTGCRVHLTFSGFDQALLTKPSLRNEEVGSNLP